MILGGRCAHHPSFTDEVAERPGNSSSILQAGDAEPKHRPRVSAPARGSNPLSELHWFLGGNLFCLPGMPKVSWEFGGGKLGPLMCSGFAVLEAAHANDPFLSGRRWRQTVICSALLRPVFSCLHLIPISVKYTHLVHKAQKPSRALSTCNFLGPS